MPSLVINTKGRQIALAAAGIELKNKETHKVTAHNKKEYNMARSALYTYRSPTLEKIIYMKFGAALSPR